MGHYRTRTDTTRRLARFNAPKGLRGISTKKDLPGFQNLEGLYSSLSFNAPEGFSGISPLYCCSIVLFVQTTSGSSFKTNEEHRLWLHREKTSMSKRLNNQVLQLIWSLIMTTNCIQLAWQHLTASTSWEKTSYDERKHSTRNNTSDSDKLWIDGACNIAPSTRWIDKARKV